MAATSDHVATIELVHCSDDRVRVRMPNNDVMVASSKAAAIACRAFADQITFKSQFDHLLDDLGSFVHEHRNKVRDAFITPQDSGILLVIVQSEKQYDRELDDAIAELEWNVARDKGYSLISLQGQLLPPVTDESLRSFLATEGTLRMVVGESESGE